MDETTQVFCISIIAAVTLYLSYLKGRADGRQEKRIMGSAEDKDRS